MKHIYLFLFSLLIGALSQRSPHLSICIKKAKKTSSLLNYRGPSLTSSVEDDSSGITLCLGDTFGDLNETYVTFQNCYFTIYHQGKEIGSFGEAQKEQDDLCAVSLEKDGNLLLHKDISRDYSRQIILLKADYGSDFRPKKNELRVQNKQFQIVHTFLNGTERIFYTGENIRGFREDLGAPRQIAEEFLIINYTNPSEFLILRRNEYIGDLDGVHLILQTNCELQLNSNNQTIWSFASRLTPGEDCALSVQEGYSIGITIIPDYGFYSHYKKTKLFEPGYALFLQSKITFQGDRLLIIQTLNNGSDIIFYSEPGQDVGLKFKREGRQIAENKIIFTSPVILRRMDYIGDLEGLHLILRDNCVLTLANGQEERWKLQESLDGPFMECNLQFYQDGIIMFNWDKNVHESSRIKIFGKKWHEEGYHRAFKFQLSLENNMIVLARIENHQRNKILLYYANQTTNGTWFQYISGDSLIANVNDEEDKFFPELGYIGDLNGVYAILNKKGNWILFNKTEPVWESGTTQEYGLGFKLVLTRDGNVAVAVAEKWRNQKEDFLWSSQTSNSYKEVKITQSELFVNNDGLWLQNMYADGVVKKFKAIEGTNNFVLFPRESFQNYDL